MKFSVSLVLLSFCAVLNAASTAEVLKRLEEVRAPAVQSGLLRTGDRLAICGDSITEQRMYSRLMETYLTACVPEMRITVRQYGWSGEKADGFLSRMENDVLRFGPTIATTCYGMNDHLYRPFQPWIGELYRAHQESIVKWFQKAGTRVVVGSAGCVGKMPSWVKSASGNVDDLNLNLATLRNLDIGIARGRKSAYADLFPVMYRAHLAAGEKYGAEYAIPGKDGVHPEWAGQAIMAYAYLHAFGLDGDLGTITVDAGSGRAKADGGHSIDRTEAGRVTVTSRRYPFVVPPGDLTKHDSIASGLQWVPFQSELNRFKLVLKGGRAERYRVTWGTASKSFPAAELRRGILLAAEFPENPFTPHFRRVDEAVAAKQAYETKQIKQEFHGNAGAQDMEATVRRTEAERAPLAEAVRNAVTPVTHVIEWTAE